MNTLAYSYYVFAEPEETPDTAPPLEPETTAAARNETPSAEAAAEIASTAGAPPEDPYRIPPGSWLLKQSPILRPLQQRYVRPRGKRPELKISWDHARSCTSFPNRLKVWLPPGRYALQASFEVLMRRRGWQHAQVARLEGVEIEEGTITEVRLRVATDGYVEVKPQSRVVFFLPEVKKSPGGEPDRPQTAPGETPSAAPDDGPD